MRSTNPVFRKALRQDQYVFDGASASYRGVVGKVTFYILMVLVGAFGGLLLMQTNENLFIILLTVSLFTTFIFSLIAMISPRLSKVFGTLYCLGIGTVAGVVSLQFDLIAPGSVLIAILSTVVVLAIIATLFLTNIVKVNGRFRRFLMTFSLSIIITMFIVWILSVTLYRGTDSFTFFRNNAIVSVVMIFLASLYLLFDLEQIRQVVEGGAPKEMEWFVAFGLVFTIVWLYFEILPLVVQFLGRD